MVNGEGGISVRLSQVARSKRHGAKTLDSTVKRVQAWYGSGSFGASDFRGFKPREADKRDLGP
jgi:hypothetical protein